MPILDKPLILWTSLLYVAITLGIGIWAVRRTRSARDFFIAGQGLGIFVVALATMSSAASGSNYLGSIGLMYAFGLGGMIFVVPSGVTAAVLCWVLAKRMRLLAEVREVFTIPDAVLARYRSRWASGLAAVAVVVGVSGYLGVQFLAVGVLLQAIVGWESLVLAMSVGVAVVLVYSVLGGMVAGVYTDVFQGAMMVGASGVALFWALGSGGGLGEMARTIAASESFGPAHVEPLGVLPAFTALGFLFVVGVGVFGSPQILHKFYMIRDPLSLRWLPWILGGSQMIVMAFQLGVGLAIPALIAQGQMAPVANPDNATAYYLLEHSPELLAGVIIASILAATMSTADSFVNIGAAALVRDLPRALGRPLRDELAWGRAATALLCAGAVALALLFDDLMLLLGTFSFGVFASTLAPVLLIGLNWKRVTPGAAIACMATGLVLSIGLELWSRTPGLPALPTAPGVLPTAISMSVSFSVLMLWSWLLGSPAGDAIDRDVRAVMDA